MQCSIIKLILVSKKCPFSLGEVCLILKEHFFLGQIVEKGFKESMS